MYRNVTVLVSRTFLIFLTPSLNDSRTSGLLVFGLKLGLLRKNIQDKYLLFQDFSSFCFFFLFSPGVIRKCGVGQAGKVRGEDVIL